MLQQSTPESRLSDAAWLDQRMAEFKKQGGRIDALPGFAPKPLPPRKEAVCIPMKPRRTSAQELRDKPIVDQFRAMQTTHTARYAAICLDLDPRRVDRMADRYDLEFLPPPKRKPE